MSGPRRSASGVGVQSYTSLWGSNGDNYNFVPQGSSASSAVSEIPSAMNQDAAGEL
jgi:hypothetical protein